MMKRKRSATIALVFIASMYLTACQGTKSPSRHVYRSLQDCSYDWGQANLCQPVTDGSYPVGYYYGPFYTRSGTTVYYYRSGYNTRYIVPANAAIIKTSNARSTRSVGTVSRGGFGKTSGSKVS